MFHLDPYSDSSFEVIGSNTSLVANFGSTSGVAYHRFFGLDPYSNVGFVMGSSNQSYNSDPIFLIGEILNDSIDAAPNFVIHNSNVGIGTKVPLDTLHVHGSARITQMLQTSNISAQQLLVQHSGTNPIAEFYKDTAIALHVGNNGNVGIGTTTPTAHLHVHRDARLNKVKTSLISNDAQTSGDAIVTTASVKVGGGVVATSLDVGSSANILLTETQDGSLTSVGYTANNVFFRVTNQGNVGIGTSVTANPLYRLHVEGNMFAADVYTNATYGLSDATLKENVRTISNPLDTICKLRGVEFEWRKDKKKSMGVIAQEIEQVIPEVVDTCPDGTKSVAYPQLVGLLIESIKQQQEEMNVMKRAIIELMNRI